MIGEKVSEMADVCDGKEIDLIASGYNKEVIPYAWLSLITGLPLAASVMFTPVLAFSKTTLFCSVKFCEPA